MNAPSPPPSEESVRFASALGVLPADLPAVGEAFSAVMARLGVDGKAVFQRLNEGKSLASALSVPPGAVPLLYARAHSWFSIGRPDKAAVLFRGLCAIAGDVADHWVGLGICLKMEGRLAEAEQALSTGAARRSDWAIPYFHLTEIFVRAGDWPRARQALADYDARVDAHTPEQVRAEAERYHTAFAVRAEGAQASSDDRVE